MTPPNPGGAASRQIDVTMTMRGAIDPTCYYFVLLNRTNTFSDPGPVAVVGLPWGNGFAAASQANAQGFVGFVLYNPTLEGSNGYQVYKVPTDSNNAPIALPTQLGTGVSGFQALGLPDQYTIPQTGETTLHFRLNLARLPNPSAQYLQVNFLATNNLPAGSDPTSPKLWDALGDGTGSGGSLNTYLTIDTTQNQIVDNSTGLEPANDVRDHLNAGVVDEPALDITGFSVQVLSN